MDERPKNKFRAWLDSKGLTYPAFAERIGEPVFTVMKWGQKEGMVPHRHARRRIKLYYKDCPLILPLMNGPK